MHAAAEVPYTPASASATRTNRAERDSHHHRSPKGKDSRSSHK
jgi:hypothetical protein